MQRLNRTNTLFILAAHLLAIAGVVHLCLAFSWWTLGLAVVWLTLSGLAITGGYHRLFAHKAYEAAAPVRAFYLLFGAAAVQNSALKWAADHRVHHASTDKEDDPYSITRGFWWAHIGWVLYQGPKRDDSPLVSDLAKDPLVRFQHRYCLPLAVLFGAVMPAALAGLWGDVLGGLLVAGFLRLVLQWHATFSINSVAHMIGRQSYCRRSSARDSFWTALLSFGEGYHNFHHRFQNDYRNGVRWYHFDPTKWFVATLSKVRLTRNLKRTPRAIIQRARAEVHSTPTR